MYFFHGRNVHGRNVRGRNVCALNVLAETSVAEMSEHHNIDLSIPTLFIETGVDRGILYIIFSYFCIIYMYTQNIDCGFFLEPPH